MLAIVALLAGCAPENGPLMAPGQDCLECHRGGEARRWTAAGTWTRGAHVSITDANGKNVPLRGNDVGNFYTAESLVPPLTVSVDGVEMATTAMSSGGTIRYGGCNICHVDRTRKPKLENMAAGRDCLACHVAGGTASESPFTVAGTWKGPGHTVKVVDRDSATIELTTNAVGNFFSSVAVQFPLREVWVDQQEMSREKVAAMTHASCNRCHGRGELEDD